MSDCDIGDVIGPAYFSGAETVDGQSADDLHEVGEGPFDCDVLLTGGCDFEKRVSCTMSSARVRHPMIDAARSTNFGRWRR
ncbi:hypothetical protein [Acetobacter oeni]|uniref:hypothetical protein n=1 Tax=Acetobacter oeni TaxID=304077 RepID=UPI0011BDFB7F|nr:hypothetical protein [Acetobacter oeni]MBB3881927.1 hypothetical protein [Acetobacter oeni]NHO17751.1 hypothetical protein [Acetobacter oeni]